LTENKESEEPEENKQPESTKETSDKLVTLNMRVTPAIKEALKKIAPDVKMTAKVTELIENDFKQSGGKIQIDTSYDRLASEVEGYRRDLDSIEKALNSKFDRINDIAQRTMPLTLENVDAIIKWLLTYKVNSQDGFSEYDKKRFATWLEKWRESKNAERKLDKIRAEKYGVTIFEPENTGQGPALHERHISEEDICQCSYRPKHTLFEHNQRAFHIQDGMKHGINQFINTPEAQLDMIKQFGMEHTTSKEEKDMMIKYLHEHGTDQQKVMLNNYFFNHNFPAPFPDLVTKELSEKQKLVVPWKPEKSESD
jgi:hypothetical protein